MRLHTASSSCGASACPHWDFARLCVRACARRGGRRGRARAHNGALQRGAHDGCADCHCIIGVDYRSKYLLNAFTKVFREAALQFGNAAGTAYHDNAIDRCLSSEGNNFKAAGIHAMHAFAILFMHAVRLNAISTRTRSQACSACTQQ